MPARRPLEAAYAEARRRKEEARTNQARVDRLLREVLDLASDAVEEWLTLNQVFVELKKRGRSQAALTRSLGDESIIGSRATRLDPEVDDQLLGPPEASTAASLEAERFDHRRHPAAMVSFRWSSGD